MPEIVIVGAGPGGLAAAKMLAEAGKDVLVLEKNEIPGLKVCAGGLTNLELSYGIPKSILERQFNRVLLNLEGTEVSLKDSGKIMCTVRRTNLGKFQAKQAQKAGAEIRYNAKVTEISKNFVKVGKEKIPFKFLIGADGSASIVREYLGLKSNKWAICMEYEVKGRFKDLEFIFNRKLFGSLFAWIFPYKNSAMIGAGCYSNEISAAEIRTNLDEWCAEKGYKIKGKKLIAAPLNMSYEGFKFKNVFLVGDAAGFIMDLTGKGIGPAIISGEEVARGILSSKYDFTQIEELLKIKAAQEKTRKIIATRPYLTKLCYLLMPALIRIPHINHKILSMVGLQ